MTRKIMLLAWALILLGSSPAWAKCPQGMVLKAIGSGQTDDALISGVGQDVHFVAGVCTGTACAATLYDSNSAGDATNHNDASVRFETGAAASTAFVHDLTDAPVRFQNGVYFEDSGNVQGIVLLSCQPS